jgi:hypothetical protein
MSELRMFTLCQGMKWAQLPVPGGLYAQHPKLIDRFYFIMAAQAEQQEKDRAKREREMGTKKPKGKGVGGSRASYYVV